jgi:hypothetical protein
VRVAIRTAITGIAAHLNLFLAGKIDPSISFRYNPSLGGKPSLVGQNATENLGFKRF